MTTDSIEVNGVIPAGQAEVYAAWLDAERHAAMTGAAATGDATVGASFTAWDGYIQGKNLSLDPPNTIVQAWRTEQFPKDAPDSRLEIRFASVEGGTQITILHSVIPVGQGTKYQSGWVDHYITPMQAYFGGR